MNQIKKNILYKNIKKKDFKQPCSNILQKELHYWIQTIEEYLFVIKINIFT